MICDKVYYKLNPHDKSISSFLSRYTYVTLNYFVQHLSCVILNINKNAKYYFHSYFRFSWKPQSKKVFD